MLNMTTRYQRFINSWSKCHVNCNLSHKKSPLASRPTSSRHHTTQHHVHSYHHGCHACRSQTHSSLISLRPRNSHRVRASFTVPNHDVRIAPELTHNTSYSGGLHLLFHSINKHTIYLPQYVAMSTPSAEKETPTDVRFLIKWMKENLLSERVEMFGDGEGV